MSWEGEGEEDEALSNRQPTAETTSRIIYIDFCSFGRSRGLGEGDIFSVLFLHSECSFSSVICISRVCNTRKMNLTINNDVIIGSNLRCLRFLTNRSEQGNCSDC